MSQVPQQETRGGNHVDWKNATAGAPLPELPEAEYLEPESTGLPWEDSEAGPAPVQGGTGQ